jgi:beta-N-acetylhexosaminidase
LVCNQPDAADEVLAGLKPLFVRGGAQRRIKQLKARGRAPRWSKLVRQPEYLSALLQVRQALG